MFRLLTTTGRVLGRVSRMCHALAQGWAPPDTQERAVISSTAYDMVGAEDEPYYGDQYWRLIQPHLAGLPRDARALDLGCGQGRFTVRLAAAFDQGHVRGCDLSGAAIAAARRYAGAEGAHNVEFHEERIGACLDGISDGTVHAALMTEVTFFHPGWADDLPKIRRCLAPGGILAVSFRPQYFYALAVVRGAMWENVETVQRRREGRVLGSSTVFTWQTSREVREILAEAGFEVLGLHGIGVCSGIAGDPHDVICRPSRLGAVERARLMDLEIELGVIVPDAGRYILAVARRRR